MIISQLRLSLADPRTNAFLANPDWQHQTLLLAFPHGPPEKIGKVRFRVEPLSRDTHSDVVTVLVQSETEPDWESEHITKRLRIVDSKKRSVTWDGLLIGQVLRFRLRANPTVKRDGKRWPIVKDEDLAAWLSRKLEMGGGTLLDTAIIPEGKMQGNRRGDSSSRKTFHSVRFEGAVRVTDVSLFRDMLAMGIGSAKGFGFGLLSVAAL